MTNDTLYILVEGETEYAVVKSFLEPYWDRRFNNCKVINYKGNGNLKAKYLRDVGRILSKPDQAVLVLIDIKNDPFYVQSIALSHSDAYQKLQKIMYAGLSMEESDNLGVFPVLVEVETWLLADPTMQRDYLKRQITHPENEDNPELKIKRLVPNYRKGLSAKKYFDKASAIDVYDDNCPHFILLANWLAGTVLAPPTRATTYPTEAREENTHKLHQEYERLSVRIELNLKHGQTAAAGVLKAERNYIEQQINDLWIEPLRDDESDDT